MPEVRPLNTYVADRKDQATTKSVPDSSKSGVDPKSLERGDFNTFGDQRGEGYHPVNKRMIIRPEVDPSKELLCHYDPSEFSEEYTAEYADVPVVGDTIQPIAYKFSHPRKWTMKLLFNDLGESFDKRQQTDTKTTQEALDYLRAFMTPKNYRGVVSIANSDKPPVLLVFLTNQYFRCCLTTMTVRRLKIHPSGGLGMMRGQALRAEVDVTFVEFIEGQAIG